jgi:Ca2+-binding EF-hand superfamily protein
MSSDTYARSVLKTDLSAGAPVKGFSRTSDIVGSHEKKDLDAYLTLIRRKIQEKVGTTQDLIQQIRRNKIGDSGHVTPNEFRFTLIKFGVILPQPLVDRIFNVFDSDRSGTMDFDEFAMWIMNAEFRDPIEATETPAEIRVRKTNDENAYLRKKLQKCIKLHSAVFRTMKKTISFQEWVSYIGRGKMPMTEREARAVFMLFDPNDTGFVGAKHLMNWAETGDLKPPPPSASAKKALAEISLKDAIRQVAGKNLSMVHKSFEHMPRNQGIRVNFEEFRRCLLTNGLGRNVMETKQLFIALGGKSGTCDVDMLMNEVSNRGPIDPQAAVSMKKERDQVSNLSAADRSLREAVRKSYKEIKATIDEHDRGHTGYILASDLHKILLKLCIPLSFQDFRYVIQHINTSDHGSKVNIHHFLEAYNPRHLPHQLAGGRGVIDAALKTTQAMSPIATLRSPATGATGGMGASRSDNILGRSDSKKGLSINEDMRKVDPSGELRQIWQRVLRECHRQDPERSGCVKRLAFINALEVANAKSVMNAETMSKLADRYDAGFGLINYLACFRTYLTAMTSTAIAPEKKERTNKGAPVRDHGANHPWQFEYEKRGKHSQPYWSSATAQPKNVHAAQEQAVPVPDANHRAAHQLSDIEKQTLLSKYEPKVLNACKRVYAICGDGGAAWKELRNEMKVHQINSQRGCILTTNWYKLCESYNIKLSISAMGALTRAFRGLGNQDVIKYNDLVRVCTLAGQAA